jgi:formylmethanofuran:tetrahydromethanopterin formyltransferase
MRIARIAAVVVLIFMCICVPAMPQTQTKMSVTGTLARAMAIGGESTGWSIQVDPEITVDGKPVHSIEISYKDAQKLEQLANKRVKAAGKLTHKHGIETGERAVLEVSSIKETKSK